jgi:hypothetical protein
LVHQKKKIANLKRRMREKTRINKIRERKGNATTRRP